MAFGGFICSKNALTALNSLYMVVAVILIGVGAYAEGSSMVTNLPVVAGIIATGVFLMLVAILGLYGASKHHQVILFFYMIILFLVFLIQFFVAVACLAISEPQLTTIIEKAWKLESLSNSTRITAAKHFSCCNPPLICSEDSVDWCGAPKASCEDCFTVIPQSSKTALHVAGAVGLFFSFTEFFGVWLTLRFRNLRDPKYNNRNFI